MVQCGNPAAITGSTAHMNIIPLTVVSSVLTESPVEVRQHQLLPPYSADKMTCVRTSRDRLDRRHY